MEESRSESIVFTIFIGTLDGNLVCPCNDLRLGQVLGEGSRTGQSGRWYPDWRIQNARHRSSGGVIKVCDDNSGRVCSIGWGRESLEVRDQQT